MNAPSDPGPEPRDAPAGSVEGAPERAFRWQAFFRRATDALFVLDRRGRLLFVNPAWEALAGAPFADASRFVCRRPRPSGPGDSLQTILEHALTPPPEVLQGTAARVRRLLPGGEAARRWWDVEFFPVRLGGKSEGLLLLGRITTIAAEETTAKAPLPERLVALRERVAQRYGLELAAGDAPALRRLSEQVRLAARTNTPVLLVGEPGTGKRSLARAIHYLGPRRERSFAALDCARLPPAALADALFGGRPGAPGTVYLNEPSRLPRDLQLRLCERIATADASPRILAGSAADPHEEVRAGRLLEELHCALAVLTLHVPPLRERRDDLPRLVQGLLERCNEDGEPHITGLTPEAREVLIGHAWPGNLRELYAVLFAARRHAKRDRIDAADLPAYLRLTRRLFETPDRPAERPLPLDSLLEQVERRLIGLALRRAKGNQTRAAEILSIWRPRLHRRMKALGIDGVEEPTLEIDPD